MNNFTSGGAPTDELTATPAEVMAGYKFLGAGSDDEQVGTLALTGNAVVNHVLQGETFYSTNPKTKLTGTMTVNSVLSFSAQVVSGRQILCKWQNPTTANGKPYSGVCINYSTSGNPGTGGTRLYTGVGSSSASGANSQVYLNLPNLSTTYFLSCYSYVNINNGTENKYGTIFNTSLTTQGTITVNFGASRDYTVPAGYTLMDVFLAGGGSSGGRGYGSANSTKYAGNGGGGGYTKTQRNISVAGGQVLKFTVGTRGEPIAGANVSDNLPAAYNNGGASTVARSGTILSSAAGGNGWAGGSGGGVSGVQIGDSESGYNHYVGVGGSNGGNGGGTPALMGTPARPGGPGQGSTTGAWGNSANVRYGAGGGGGGNAGARTSPADGGNGGAPGGGKGGMGYGYGTTGNPGTNASANTGAGGGGGGGSAGNRGSYGGGGAGGAGGTGFIIATFH